MPQRITFHADQVKVKTGKVDNSADVTFTVGEYELHALAPLISLIDVNLEVTVEVEE